MCGCLCGGYGVWLDSVKFLILQIESDIEYLNCDVNLSRGSGGNVNIHIIAVTKWRRSSEIGIVNANWDCKFHGSVVFNALVDLRYILLRGIFCSFLRSYPL